MRRHLSPLLITAFLAFFHLGAPTAVWINPPKSTPVPLNPKNDRTGSPQSDARNLVQGVGTPQDGAPHLATNDSPSRARH